MCSATYNINACNGASTGVSDKRTRNGMVSHLSNALNAAYGHVGTVGLPPELQRLLKTIQDLDERAQGACTHPAATGCYMELPPGGVTVNFNDCTYNTSSSAPNGV